MAIHNCRIAGEESYGKQWVNRFNCPNYSIGNLDFQHRTLGKNFNPILCNLNKIPTG